MIYYWIASALIAVVIDFGVGTVAPFETSSTITNALQLVLTIPMFALFVRRLHDQNKSGWWGVLLPLSVLLSMPHMVAEASGNVDAIIAQKTTVVGIAAGLCGLAVFVLCLLPGSVEANRYGPDPRLEQA